MLVRDRAFRARAAGGGRESSVYTSRSNVEWPPFEGLDYLQESPAVHVPQPTHSSAAAAAAASVVYIHDRKNGDDERYSTRTTSRSVLARYSHLQV